MSIGQLDSQDSLAPIADAVGAEWLQAPRPAQVPKRINVDASSLRASRDPLARAAQRTWWSAAVRVLRNACLGVAMISAVPFAVIAVRGDVLWFKRGDIQQRLAEAEPMRAFAAAINPDVTLEQAGAAMHALQALPTSDQFPTRPHAAPLERGWKSAAGTDEQRLTSEFAALPDPKGLIVKAHGGIDADELAQLRSIAESPVWSAVEAVATAKQVDFIGSQFVVPFTADAWAPAMPIHRMQNTRDIANAGIARAAYYVAIEDYERAEQSLRSIVSYGFAFIDNGWSAIDGLLGRVIVGLARNGLAELAQVTAEASSNVVPDLKSPGNVATGSSTAAETVDDIRVKTLRDATDPSIPRPLRYEALSRLALGSCGDVRYVLTGTSPDVRAAFDNARSTLARFPAEQAFLDLLYRTPGVVPANATAARSLSQRLILGAATVAGTALQNPRVVSCTRTLMQFERADR